MYINMKVTIEAAKSKQCTTDAKKHTSRSEFIE